MKTRRETPGAWRRRAGPRLRRGEVTLAALVDEARAAASARGVDPEAALRWVESAVHLVDGEEARSGEVDGEAAWKARRHLARLHHSAGRHGDALAILEALRPWANTSQRRADLESVSGALLARMGRMDEAAAAMASARRVLARTGDRVALAHVELNEANLCHRREQHRRALALYRRARRRLAGLGRPHDLGLADLGIGNVLTYRAEVAEARRAFGRAEAAFERAGSAGAAVVARYNTAYLELLAGRPQAALDGLEAARRDFERLGDERGVANCELDASEVSGFLAIWPEAAAHARAALERTDRLHMGTESARSRLHLARALALGRGGGRGEATRLLEEAASTFRHEGNEVGEATADLQRAELLERAGGPEAIGLARRAAATLRRHGFTSRAALALLVEARALSHDGGASRRLARRRLQQALALRGRDAWSRVHVPALLGRLDLEDGDVRSARRRAELAMSAIERVAEDVSGDVARASLMGSGAGAFALGTDAWLAGNPDAGRAFACAERGRRFALKGPRSRTARARGHAAAGRLEGGRVMGLRRGEAALADETSSRGRSASAEPLSTLLSLRAIRGLLADGEKLVQFGAGAEARRAFVVDGAGVEVLELPDAAVSRLAAALAATAERTALLSALQGSRSSDATERALAAARRARTEAASRAGAVLLEPVAAALAGATRAFVVADEAALGIPWGVLAFASARIAKDLELVVLPTASFLDLRRLPRARRQARERVVVFGVGDSSAPGVEAEARAVAASWGTRAVLRLGAHASMKDLARLAGTATVLHLAVHGSYRDDAPERSALQLGGGWTTAVQLEELRLRGAVVVLSSCRTGALGGVGGGQFLGPVRSLLRAGARCVVASPWSVSDADAVTLLPAFHQALAGGADAASALRHAAEHAAVGDALLARSFLVHGVP